MGPVADVADLGFTVLDGLAAGWLTIVLLLVVILTLVFLPLLVLVIEVVVLVLAGVAGVFARVALRRPWLIDAEARRERRTWAVIGWAAAGRATGEVAAALERGELDHVPHGAELPEIVRDGPPPSLGGRPA